MRTYVSRARQSKTLVAQAEDLLAGRSLGSYQKKGVAAPPWALMNLLAHASYEDLARLARRAASTKLGTWDEAVCSLSGELVRIEFEEKGLFTVQRQALLPLEVGLLGGALTSPRTPDQLISIVREALHQPRIDQ